MANLILAQADLGKMANDIGSFDFGLSGEKITETVVALWKLFIFDNNVVYQAISTPFVIVAGIGFLYNIIPLMKMDEASRRQAFKSVFGMFVILMMFVNNVNFGRQVVSVEYAFVKGSQDLIVKSLDQAANLSKLAKDLDGNEAALAEITAASKACLAIPAVTEGKDNPAFLKCSSDIRALVNQKTSQGLIEGTTVDARLKKAANAPDPFTFIAANLQAAGRYVNDAFVNDAKAGFDAAIAVVSFIGDIAMLISAIIFPYNLSMAMFNPKPLFAWHAMFWGAATFTICNSVLSGLFTYMNASLSAALPVLAFDYAIGIFAPIIAGCMAVGGGIAVFQALTQVAATGISVVTKKI
jgi:hypothetical protein